MILLVQKYCTRMRLLVEFSLDSASRDATKHGHKLWTNLSSDSTWVTMVEGQGQCAKQSSQYTEIFQKRVSTSLNLEKQKITVAYILQMLLEAKIHQDSISILPLIGLFFLSLSSHRIVGKVCSDQCSKRHSTPSRHWYHTTGNNNSLTSLLKPQNKYKKCNLKKKTVHVYSSLLKHL